MQVNPNKDLELFALAHGSPEAVACGCICPATDGAEDHPLLNCRIHGTQRLLKVLAAIADETSDDAGT